MRYNLEVKPSRIYGRLESVCSLSHSLTVRLYDKQVQYRPRYGPPDGHIYYRESGCCNAQVQGDLGRPIEYFVVSNMAVCLLTF